MISLWQQIASAIVNPWLTLLLVVLGSLLIFIDLLTPKTWRIEGTLGVLFVGLVFAAHITEGSGGWIGVLLALLGITGLLLETHVFPGTGISAIGGLLFLFLGIFWSLGGPANLPLALPIATLLTIVSLIAFFAYLPRTALWKEIGAQMQQRTLLASSSALAPSPEASEAALLDLLGRQGETATPLRPIGTANFGGIHLQVVTEGDFLEAGARIVVTQIDGGRIVVEPLAAHHLAVTNAAAA